MEAKKPQPQPTILYDEENPTIPFMETGKDIRLPDRIPFILFVFEFRETKETVTEKGKTLNVVDAHIQAYWDINHLKEKLSKELFAEVKKVTETFPRKTEKIPVFTYGKKSTAANLPYLETNEKTPIPTAFFLFEYKHTGESELDTSGNEKPIIEEIPHKFVNSETLKSNLTPVDYNKIRAALNLLLVD